MSVAVAQPQITINGEGGDKSSEAGINWNGLSSNNVYQPTFSTNQQTPIENLIFQFGTGGTGSGFTNTSSPSTSPTTNTVKAKEQVNSITINANGKGLQFGAFTPDTKAGTLRVEFGGQNNKAFKFSNLKGVTLASGTPTANDFSIKGNLEFTGKGTAEFSLNSTDSATKAIYLQGNITTQGNSNVTLDFKENTVISGDLTSKGIGDQNAKTIIKANNKDLTLANLNAQGDTTQYRFHGKNDIQNANTLKVKEISATGAGKNTLNATTITAEKLSVVGPLGKNTLTATDSITVGSVTDNIAIKSERVSGQQAKFGGENILNAQTITVTGKIIADGTDSKNSLKATKKGTITGDIRAESTHGVVTTKGINEITFKEGIITGEISSLHGKNIISFGSGATSTIIGNISTEVDRGGHVGDNKITFESTTIASITGNITNRGGSNQIDFKGNGTNSITGNITTSAGQTTISFINTSVQNTIDGKIYADNNGSNTLEATQLKIKQTSGNSALITAYKGTNTITGETLTLTAPSNQYALHAYSQGGGGNSLNKITLTGTNANLTITGDVRAGGTDGMWHSDSKITNLITASNGASIDVQGALIIKQEGGWHNGQYSNNIHIKSSQVLQNSLSQNTIKVKSLALYTGESRHNRLVIGEISSNNEIDGDITKLTADNFASSISSLAGIITIGNNDSSQDVITINNGGSNLLAANKIDVTGNLKAQGGGKNILLTNTTNGNIEVKGSLIANNGHNALEAKESNGTPTITITDGTITAQNGSNTLKGKDLILKSDSQTITLTAQSGGTNNLLANVKNGSIKITNGTITASGGTNTLEATGTNGSLTITNGTIKASGGSNTLTANSSITINNTSTDSALITATGGSNTISAKTIELGSSTRTASDLLLVSTDGGSSATNSISIQSEGSLTIRGNIKATSNGFGNQTQNNITGEDKSSIDIQGVIQAEGVGQWATWDYDRSNNLHINATIDASSKNTISAHSLSANGGSGTANRLVIGTIGDSTAITKLNAGNLASGVASLKGKITIGNNGNGDVIIANGGGSNLLAAKDIEVKGNTIATGNGKNAFLFANALTFNGNIQTDGGSQTNITMSADSATLTLKGENNAITNLTASSNATNGDNLVLDATSNAVNANIATLRNGDKLKVELKGGNNNATSLTLNTASLKTLTITSGTNNTLKLAGTGTTTITDAVSVGANKGIAFDLTSGSSVTFTGGLTTQNNGTTTFNLKGNNTITGTLTNNGTTNINFDDNTSLAVNTISTTSGITNFNLKGNNTITGTLTNNGTHNFNFNGEAITLKSGISLSSGVNNLNFSAGTTTLKWQTSDGTTSDIATTDGTTNINLASGANAIIGENKQITTSDSGTTNVTLQNNATLALGGTKNTITTLTGANGSRVDLARVKSDGFTPLEREAGTYKKLTIGAGTGANARAGAETKGFKGQAEFEVYVGTDNKADEIIFNSATKQNGKVSVATITASGDRDTIVNGDGKTIRVATVKQGAKGNMEVQGGTKRIGTLDVTTKLNPQDKNGDTEYYLGKGSVRINKGYQEIASTALISNYDLYIANFNSLNKRMGELRDNPNSQGVWTRVFGGAMSSDFATGSKTNYITTQAGYDYGFGFSGARNYLGVSLAYGKSWTKGNAINIDNHDGTSTTASLSSLDSSLVEVGVYNSYVSDSGWYNDTILKFDYIMSEFSLSEFSSLGKTPINNFAMILSNEVGYRYEFGGNKDWYVDPQLELAFGYFSQSEFNREVNNIKVKGIQDAIFTLRSRVGSALGKKFEGEKGSASLYVGAFYEFDYIAGGDATAGSLGFMDPLSSKLSSNGRAIVNVGSNIALGEATRLYIDVEKSFGEEQRTFMQFNAGVRYSFGESNGYTPQEKKNTASAPLKIEKK